MRRLALATLALLVVAAIVGGGALWRLDGWGRSEGPSEERIVVDIPSGAGLREIAGRLERAGVIRSQLAWQARVLLRGESRELRAGEFAFEPHIAPDQVIEQLTTGNVVLHPVTIAEGLTVQEVMTQLAEDARLSGPLPKAPPEGHLMPDTYLVPRDEPRAKLVERMEKAMRRALEEVWAERVPGLPLENADQALTLASLIERETALPEEYPVVAAVFINRLREGMPLQTDPTVIYALADGKGTIGRPLTRADLAVEHPYNTYLNHGLPPGPIANPGIGAMRAAVAPADVDFLYFVADGTGGHRFARTLAEHNRNVAAWRQGRPSDQGRRP